MHKETLIHQLYEIGAVQFGSFPLKSGKQCPFHIDLRRTISYPKLLVAIGEALHQSVRGYEYDLICGVPFTAIPFATAISIQHLVPMIMRRTEKKDFGTESLIEGVYRLAQRCLIIEDVMVSGQSILDTIEPLEKEGIAIEDIAILIDRQQGGRRFLESKEFRVHTVCTLSEIVQELLMLKKIDEETAHCVCTFIQENQVHG